MVITSSMEVFRVIYPHIIFLCFLSTLFVYFSCSPLMLGYGLGSHISKLCLNYVHLRNSFIWKVSKIKRVSGLFKTLFSSFLLSRYMENGILNVV